MQVLWEFRVAAETAAQFERAYGPGGDWVRLFHRAAAYQGTTLLKDSADPLRYVTVDRWTSRAAYDAFRRQFADEYDAIDRRCANLTRSETLLGYFDDI